MRATGRITTLFQPIVHLADGTVAGYEALSRGPAGTALESPRALFAEAERLGLLSELEQTCWASALRSLHAQTALAPARPLLFLNVLPDEIATPGYLESVDALLEETGIPASGIVIELTESTRIDNYPRFLQTIDVYRKRGFHIAVDDAGAGHSGLQTIVEVEPDIVKLDRSLIRGIDQHPARRAAVEAMIHLTRQIGGSLVAEGVERPQELLVVRELGIGYAQGYLLARPQARLPQLSAAAESLLLPRGPAERLLLDLGGAAEPGLSAGDIVQASPSVPAHLDVPGALDLLSGHKVDALVVVNEEERPEGLISRSRLLEALSRPFGRELYLRRAVETVATPDPLVVDRETSLATVSRLAMARDEDLLYDPVVVAEGGRYIGILSVRQLLDAITEMRLKAARDANPLTGLPGNPEIERVLRSYLRGGREIGVLHIDLDDFKAFNDVYGFHRGDDAIRFTATVLRESLAEHGGEPRFLGHIGGDDFLAVVPAATADEVARLIAARFLARVPDLYAETDRQRGYILARSRSGELRRFSIMSLTVASLIVRADGSRHYADVLDALAEVKRQRKAATRRDRDAPDRHRIAAAER